MKFASVLAFALLAACDPPSSREAGINAKADAHGGAVRLDTEANRRELTLGYDLDIDSEKHTAKNRKPQMRRGKTIGCRYSGVCKGAGRTAPM
jgi:hypothetical protein